MPMDELAKRVWENTYGAATKAQDVCTAWISKGAHGQQGEHGWEIDHIIPKARGGSDALTNLRPLHWQNNDAKGDRLDGSWSCAIRARK